jgi:transforming growth factor-beta-induced protein
MRIGVNRAFAIATIAVVALAACGDDGNDAAENSAAAAATTTPAPTTAAASGTIVDVASAAGNFSTLVAAVQAAGLVETLSGPGPFTVFAPTDEAFTKALDAAGMTPDQLLADTATLKSILTYHVIAGAVPSSAVMTMDGQSVATVNGADVKISVNGDKVKVNDANVTAVDIPASNGVIHVIDSVLLPPDFPAPPVTSMAPANTTAASTTAAASGTIVDVASAAGNFTTLVAAVQAAGLVETLSGPGPFTVFAPTDEAFTKALDALGMTADQLLADTATLKSILTYHVIAGAVPSSAVMTMDGQSVATVNGADVKIGVDGDTVKVNDATVTAVDIPASNGIIHVIDSVLLPPAA